MVIAIVDRLRTTAAGRPGFLTEYRCLSTDTKPPAHFGDSLIEIDTQKVYFFDGENWLGAE